jgi:mono/diheme cytochrome c family protein
MRHLLSPRVMLALCWALAGCNDPPGDLRTWRPEDHDHTTNPGQNQVVAGPDAGTAPELAQIGLDEVTVIAWQQNCTRCHGRIGRGDGPQSQMFRATDLTNPAWQRAVTDDQIFASIKNGRGQMPPFALPDSTIRSLVRLVRVLDSSKIPPPGSSGTPTSSAAPGASARAAPSATSRPAPSANASPAPSAR